MTTKLISQRQSFEPNFYRFSRLINRIPLKQIIHLVYLGIILLTQWYKNLIFSFEIDNGISSLNDQKG